MERHDRRHSMMGPETQHDIIAACTGKPVTGPSEPESEPAAELPQAASAPQCRLELLQEVGNVGEALTPVQIECAKSRLLNGYPVALPSRCSYALRYDAGGRDIYAPFSSYTLERAKIGDIVLLHGASSLCASQIKRKGKSWHGRPTPWVSTAHGWCYEPEIYGRRVGSY